MMDDNLGFHRATNLKHEITNGNTTRVRMYAAKNNSKGLKESTTPSGRLTFIIIHARLIHISGASVSVCVCVAARVLKRSKIRDRGQTASRRFHATNGRTDSGNSVRRRREKKNGDRKHK